MASGDTKTEAMLNTLGNGGDADEFRGCCNTKTQQYILDAIDRVQNVEDEVEELKNNPDVVDIVDTYADLQAYDTSKLTDKDIIRVLTDETHSGNSTYYRFAKDTNTWTFIGEVSGGVNVVQTGGTSTTDVMSQNATTSMVFADPNSRTQIRIGNTGSVSTDSVSIGHNASCNTSWGVAIGSGATAAQSQSVSIGYNTRAHGSGHNVAIGDYAVAHRNDNNQNIEYSVSLGAYAQAKRSGEVNIGTGTGSHGYNSTSYRVLGGVHDGQTANDAATFGQVISYSAINGAGAPTTTTEGRYVGQLYYDTTNEAMHFLKTIDTTTTPATYTWEALGGGSSVNVVQTAGTSTTDVMSQNAVTSMVFADPGTNKKVRIGNTNSSGNNSICIGSGGSASSSFSIVLGSANVYGNNSIAIGRSALVPSGLQYSVALGAYSSVSRAGEVNIGTGTDSYGYNSTKYRVLGGVHDGQNAHDAATVAQGNTLATSAPTTSTVGVLGQLYTDTTGMHTYQCTAISGDTYTWTQRW